MGVPARMAGSAPADRSTLFALRLAVVADVDALVDLEERCFAGDRMSRRSFRKLVDAPTAALAVAQTPHGDLVGYALLLFRAGTGMARLYSIAVAPDRRSAGIGEALMAEAERLAFARDRIVLRLEVREDNPGAIRLYERLGFRRIGRYLDYYEDHANALRYEKRLRGAGHSTAVPYYEQTTDFTCGPCCVMMALAHFRPDYTLAPVEEIKLWRQATTVFMMSGVGGCDPHGLAVSAARNGLAAAVHVSRDGSLFLDSVRDPEKRRVMTLAQEDFRRQTIAFDIPIFHTPLDVEAIRAALAEGALVIVLVSAYAMFGKKVPHWILVVGDDGRHLFVHDPWVEDRELETHADAANLPIPYADFERMARWGREPLRAAVVLKQR
ncbi:GNAT family N-acetyltransferase/peptidase C39 family protein [Kaistia dalseonensis]|uniref:Ribosomal protein S18 acetylase RimI-like enzyme n=1 Tax=Kaistia dalseonensis TaxID=410840 RepID=A0ABU0H754_9HYPH|nr:GNAT family N-acetyltransferase/peptidase C39 family protein [Kaistia dalseonensis]MCX5495024.1 GNAT family N-acetyltransferase/peptidase C39 family protein [Kaistia dalseonensis]MDQ0437605.1 ribosomal protein S18 acetylase RimI-like enzyme [Kaistia dalseonensis]